MSEETEELFCMYCIYVVCEGLSCSDSHYFCTQFPFVSWTLLELTAHALAVLAGHAQLILAYFQSLLMQNSLTNHSVLLIPRHTCSLFANLQPKASTKHCQPNKTQLKLYYTVSGVTAYLPPLVHFHACVKQISNAIFLMSQKQMEWRIIEIYQWDINFPVCYPRKVKWHSKFPNWWFHLDRDHT